MSNPVGSSVEAIIKAINAGNVDGVSAEAIGKLSPSDRKEVMGALELRLRDGKIDKAEGDKVGQLREQLSAKGAGSSEKALSGRSVKASAKKSARELDRAASRKGARKGFALPRYVRVPASSMGEGLRAYLDTQGSNLDLDFSGREMRPGDWDTLSQLPKGKLSAVHYPGSVDYPIEGERSDSFFNFLRSEAASSLRNLDVCFDIKQLDEDGRDALLNAFRNNLSGLQSLSLGDGLSPNTTVMEPQDIDTYTEILAAVPNLNSLNFTFEPFSYLGREITIEDLRPLMDQIGAMPTLQDLLIHGFDLTHANGESGRLLYETLLVMRSLTTFRTSSHLFNYGEDYMDRAMAYIDTIKALSQRGVKIFGLNTSNFLRDDDNTLLDLLIANLNEINLSGIILDPADRHYNAQSFDRSMEILDHGPNLEELGGILDFNPERFERFNGQLKNMKNLKTFSLSRADSLNDGALVALAETLGELNVTRVEFSVHDLFPVLNEQSARTFAEGLAQNPNLQQFDLRGNWPGNFQEIIEAMEAVLGDKLVF